MGWITPKHFGRHPSPSPVMGLLPQYVIQCYLLEWASPFPPLCHNHTGHRAARYWYVEGKTGCAELIMPQQDLTLHAWQLPKRFQLCQL